MKNKSNNQNIISEIKKLAKVFRNELKKTERVLRQEILKVEEKTEELADGQRELHIKLSRIENTLDGFVGTVDDLRKDNVVGTHQTRELEVKVDGHEKRIKQFESATQTP